MKLLGSFFWVYLLPRSLVKNLATLGGLGYKSKMPGTLGSIIGFIFYVIFFHNTNGIYYFLLLFIFSYISFGICQGAEKHFMEKDPSFIILDEFVAIPFIYIGLNVQNTQVLEIGSWPVYLGGILIFRFFDIFKPFGIKRLEKINGGLGCVLDDIAAGLLSCLCLHILIWKFI